MERDQKFILEALEDIRVNAEAMNAYDICGAMLKKGHDFNKCIWHLRLMKDSGYFTSAHSTRGRAFWVTGLSNKGYEFLENTKDESTTIQIYIDNGIHFEGDSKIKNSTVNAGSGTNQVENSKTIDVGVSLSKENKPCFLGKLLSRFRKKDN